MQEGNDEDREHRLDRIKRRFGTEGKKNKFRDIEHEEDEDFDKFVDEQRDQEKQLEM
jgi:hypothetical protein